MNNTNNSNVSNSVTNANTNNSNVSNSVTNANTNNSNVSNSVTNANTNNSNVSNSVTNANTNTNNSNVSNSANTNNSNVSNSANTNNSNVSNSVTNANTNNSNVSNSANTNNSNVSNSVVNANANAITEADVLNHMKGLKFHTIMLFKKDGKIIDALSIDNNFTKERLNEYREKYQYGKEIPDKLRAPQTFSEWWEQLNVKQYFKNQMDKDYLMSLYLKSLDDNTQPSDINVEHHTISVNTDSDVTDFLDFLNNLRETLDVKMQSGGTPLEDKINDKRKDYVDTIKDIKKTKDLYDKYGNLPIVKEIFGKAAIKELIKTMPKDKIEEELKKLYDELDAIVNANTSTIPMQQPQQQTLTKEAIITMLKTPKTYEGLFTP